MRYTLCEMSLIWHMYGGNDFIKRNESKKSSSDEIAVNNNKSKKVNFVNDLKRFDVGYSNTGTGEVIFTNFMEKEKKNNERNWLINGGVNRDHNVLMELKLSKVRTRKSSRFLYEPPNDFFVCLF